MKYLLLVPHLGPNPPTDMSDEDAGAPSGSSAGFTPSGAPVQKKCGAPII